MEKLKLEINHETKTVRILKGDNNNSIPCEAFEYCTVNQFKLKVMQISQLLENMLFINAHHYDQLIFQLV